MYTLGRRTNASAGSSVIALPLRYLHNINERNQAHPGQEAAQPHEHASLSMPHVPTRNVHVLVHHSHFIYMPNGIRLFQQTHNHACQVLRTVHTRRATDLSCTRAWRTHTHTHCAQLVSSHMQATQHLMQQALTDIAKHSECWRT